MVKRAVPRVVVLPNVKRFTARYKRAARASLSTNVTLNRTYKQRGAPRNRRQLQKGRGIGSLMKKVIKNPIVRKLTKEVLKETPKFAGKVKNKKLKRVLQSDIANSLVEKGTSYGRNRLD